LFPDPVGAADFVGKDLQTGQLLVGLSHLLLQGLVADTKHLRFMLQRIVVGDLPGHARIAAHNAESDQANQGKNTRNAIDEAMRDVYAL